jgi:membrane protease YdiL (CAAX protease family)
MAPPHLRLSRRSGRGAALGALHSRALRLFVVVIREKFVWRSLVLDELTARSGTRRGWPLAALAYGVTARPTLYTLRDPVAGYNPLLVTAALGGGIVWSFFASLNGHLVPVIIAHAVFSYFSLVQFRWPS